MKAVLTLVLVLFFGAISVAQNTNTNDKVDVLQLDVVLVTGAEDITTFEEVTVTAQNSVARLYRYKNSRVKKELAFLTKRNSPKMA